MAAGKSADATMSKGLRKTSGAKLRGRFSKPAHQAAAIMKNLQGSVLKSVGTVRNYEAALTRVAEHLRDARLGALAEITPDKATDYLRQRALVVGQKTLDLERQALQSMMVHVTQKMEPGHKLVVVKSVATPLPSSASGSLGRRLSEQSRIYSAEQVAKIVSRQAVHNALATEIAYATGLRAHELLTLQRRHRREPHERPVHQEKFLGLRNLDTLAYSVVGKGGLIREIRIPMELARRLEARRLAQPRRVTDRGIFYQQSYDLGGGQPWSKSFSAASTKTLGWSNGAHGLRHSYAQQRMALLQKSMPREAAKEVVSQELGHFRPDITEIYLR